MTRSAYAIAQRIVAYFDDIKFFLRSGNWLNHLKLIKAINWPMHLKFKLVAVPKWYSLFVTFLSLLFLRHILRLFIRGQNSRRSDDCVIKVSIHKWISGDWLIPWLHQNYHADQNVKKGMLLNSLTNHSPPDSLAAHFRNAINQFAIDIFYFIDIDHLL